MSIFSKIITAIRGGASEAGEAIVDANATRIFAQEIRDAENHLTKAKRDLTGIMAKQMQAKRELDRINRSITEHEGYATTALNQGNEALALEVAEKIAGLEAELAEQQASFDNYEKGAIRLKDLVKGTERQLADYQRQLSMVKTTESVQKATAAITDNFSNSNSKLLNAKQSLERIKEKQQDFDDRVDILPVADPNIFSQTQRISLAQTELQLATSNPQMHNLYQAYRNMYEALGVKNIENFGAVSEQVALEMAENIRNKFGTSIGVSTTGIAGPGGGSKDKPVGLVYVGYCDDKSLKVKRFNFSSSRESNKIRTTQAVLNYVFKMI